jgi:hypothetical protein
MKTKRKTITDGHDVRAELEFDVDFNFWDTLVKSAAPCYL